MRKHRIASLLLWSFILTTTASANDSIMPYRIRLDGKPTKGFICLTPQQRHDSQHAVGYDFTASPTPQGKAPYFISFDVPDGNYKVTVTLGSKKMAAHTTVRAESRRLFLNDIATRKGEFKTFQFIVNKRNTLIDANHKVRIKERERNKPNWDDKLTIEINGTQPACQSIVVEKADAVPTVFLAGNSTVVDQDYEPWASWGQMIPSMFTNQVAFANYAESGECANTFIEAGRLQKALTQMKPGDWIFIEFGHNDQKQKGPGKGAYYSFATSLKTFIDEARQRGVQPVFVTPTQRRVFKDGKIVETHANYPEAMLWVAQREQVPVIDLHSLTRTLFEAMGEEGSKKAFVHYPAGTYPGQTKPFADNTHFNPYGAYQIAKCVVEGMRSLNLPLVKYLKDGTPHFNPAQPDDIHTFHWDDSPFSENVKPDGN